MIAELPNDCTWTVERSGKIECVLRHESWEQIKFIFYSNKSESTR